jgi:hypothetical protein
MNKSNKYIKMNKHTKVRSLLRTFMAASIMEKYQSVLQERVLWSFSTQDPETSGFLIKAARVKDAFSIQPTTSLLHLLLSPTWSMLSLNLGLPTKF